MNRLAQLASIKNQILCKMMIVQLKKIEYFYD